MAISLRAAGSWIVSAAVGNVSPTAPAGGAAGDRTYVFAVWKDFSRTATCASNSGGRAYTEIDESTDGAVAVGNGTGSVKVAIYYKDWASGDDDPTVTWSGGNIDVALTAVVIFQKDASDTWNAPTFTNGNQASSSTISVTGGSDLGFTADDLLLAILGIRDDGTFTSFSATATGITWAAALAQAPSTNGSTTSGNDLSAAAGYRIASSGTSSAAPTMSGTLGAAETGRGTFIRQSVTTTAGERVPFYRPHIPLLPH